MNQNEQNIKGIFYQNKTHSEKSKPGGGKEKLQTFQLLNLLEKGTPQTLKSFLDKDHPSSQILNQGIIKLIKNYQIDDQKLYELLQILFSYGASPDIPIINKNLTETDSVTLLMFGIKNNDLKLIKLVLNYKPEIDKADKHGRNAIIYAVYYDHNDSTNIINLLIMHKANINYSFKIQISQDQYESQSVFTLAISKDLKNITKCLLDNNVDVNFRTQLKGDTALHIAAQYAKVKLVELLLNNPKILSYVDVKNKDGKTPIDLVKDNDIEKNEKIKIFKNSYNILNNLRINNQNVKIIYSEMNNNNLKNINHQISKVQQINPLMQLNKIHEFNNTLNNINNNNYQKFEHHYNNNNMNNLNNTNLSNIFGDNNNNQYVNMQNNYMNNDLNQENNNNIIENNENNFNQISKLNNIIMNNYPNKNNEFGKNINNKENEIFPNQRTQEKNQFINQKNHNNKNISYINQNKLTQIKKKLNNKLLNKKNINYNIEIPIEFINNNHKQYNNNTNSNIFEINNFIKQSNIPILNIDLSNKELSLELKLNDLKEKLKNLNVKYKDMANKLQNIEECKEMQEEIKTKKKNDLEFIKLKVNENKVKKDNLILEQKELLKELPSDKILQESNKNIAEIEIRRLKFEPPKLDQNYIIKVLNKDLIDYEKYINYIMLKKKPKINLILGKLKSIISEAFPDYEIKIYGAYAQGLSLPWSDLKLILVNKNHNHREIIKEDYITDIETTTGEKTIKTNSEMDDNNLNEENSFINNNSNDVELLRNISYTFKKYNLHSQLVLNDKSSRYYLFLPTNEEYDKIKIYISKDNSEHPGLKIVELVKSYMKEYPPMRPLFLALATILKSANLNKANSGGLPSYGLILMIVSFLQSQKDNITSTFEIENINGKLFYDFLNHYGNFDFTKYMIITYLKNELNAPINEKENQFNFGPNPNIKEITILDPLNKQNNVAKCTYQFMNVKIAFSIAFMVVNNENCECGCHYGRSTFEHNYISIEHCYLKRIFNSVKRFNEPQ